MMKKNRATERDIAEIAKYSENFELDPNNIKIRRKSQLLSNELTVLGFDQDGIRGLSTQ
jgi:hypothetical protein